MPIGKSTQIALYFFFCAFTFTSFYAEASSPNDKQVYKSGDYEYVLTSDGTAEITDYFGYDYSLTIPSTLGGHKVTHLGDYAFDKGDFFEVSIPDSVTTIGANPFKRCYNLGKIVVSSDHTHFALIEGIPNAPQITTFDIPQGTISIENYAFEDCDSLTRVTIPESVTHIGYAAFQYCTSLAEINIPDSVTFIDGYAFSYCDSLTNIVIPEGLTYIGWFAFAFNESLTQINIPRSVTYIGEGAFNGLDFATIVIERNTYAEKWAKENGLVFSYPNSNDWLN